MPAKKTPTPQRTASHLVLVCGDDDFAVKSRSKSLFELWCQEVGGMDHEQIDGNAGTAGEAVQALGRLQESLQTLPFFGGTKVVWFKNVTFLGDDRTSTASAVIEHLAKIAEEWQRFDWNEVRLVISAGKVDKRRSFYKTLDKLGVVETFAALSIDDKDWAAKSEIEALRLFKSHGKSIDEEALAELVARVGPNLRSLHQEVEKLTLFALNSPEVTLEHVRSVTSHQKAARSFALAEAVGDRNLSRLLRRLDEELWEIRWGIDRKKSVIGLLYGIISKVRQLLFMRELRDSGHLRATPSFATFKSQLEKLPADWLAGDKRFNPLASHPYPLFQSFRQCEAYQKEELIGAMKTLLEANRKLVSSDLDDAVVLQQTLIQILGTAPSKL